MSANMAAKITQERFDLLKADGYPPAQAAEKLEEGAYAQAIEACLGFLESHPGNLSTRALLGKAYFHSGQHRLARETFLDLLRRDPQNLVALKYLGTLSFREGNEPAAFAYYRRALEIDPYTHGIALPVQREEQDQVSVTTIRRRGEGSRPAPKRPSLQEPAFDTETMGDLYRDQGYFLLAAKVYRRVLGQTANNRLAEKLREVELKTSADQETQPDENTAD
jgi:tetratricopeptide (TPR) repeat protein